MSPVLLRLLLALLLFMVIPKNSDAAGEELGKQWCIADEQTSDKDLQDALDWACRQGNDICSNIGEGKSCYLPNTLKDHASYAFNAYYQKFKKQGGSCYFHGAAMINELDPNQTHEMPRWCSQNDAMHVHPENCNTNADEELGKQWCIADPQTPDDILLGALNYACGKGGADCSKIQEGQPCYYPNTLLDHASYAFNDYYQKSKKTDGSCYFYGAGMIDEHDPSHDSCTFEFIPFVATRQIHSFESKINEQIKLGEASIQMFGNVTHWHTLILTMTADVIQATHEKCMKWGMDDYMSKPFGEEQLYSAVMCFFESV
ncbi:X8 [Macleaya cordata]|uniref:X8 n=1 Tax=Macleaya cordata TaxID=56857 RepID=A0A200RBS2_MACCD|nr:X8 [Macleaya cordata]